MQLIDPLIYEAYDKISDDVYWLSSKIILKFNVSLSYLNAKGERVFFHKEYKYKSNKGPNNYLKTIRRSFDYYLTIENTDKNNNDRTYIIIRNSDILSMRIALNKVLSWYTDNKYEGLYVTKNGRLIMTSPVPEYTVSQLPSNCYIKFSPDIIRKPTGVDDLEPAIMIILSSENSIIKISLSKFMGFKYIIDNFNMYESAQLMINYLGRPDLESFMYSFYDEDRRDIWNDTLKENKSSTQYNKKNASRILPSSDRINDIDRLEGE